VIFKMKKNKKNPRSKLFFIFVPFFAFLTKEAGDGASIPESPSTALIIPQPEIQAMTETPLITQGATQLPETGLKSEFQWTEVNSPEKLYTQTHRFNWYRRKILSEKTFSIYNNIVTVIANIIKSVNLFKEKIIEVNALNTDFKKNIETKITIFNQNAHSFPEVRNILFDIEKRFLECKESHLYLNNKDFRKRIDKEVQTLLNLKTMLQNIEDNQKAFEDAYRELSGSVNSLEQIKEESKNFEDIAWNKYQQLDELINDQNANKNFLEITNIFDNLTNYNFYIRNTFLQFFNQGLSNLSQGSDAILGLVDEFFQNINLFTTQINNFFTEIEQDIALEKQKFFEEQEKIRIAEEQAAAAILKKKLDLEREKNKLPWHQEALKKSLIYTQDVFSKAKNYLVEIGTKIINYYNKFFNKSLFIQSIKKHNPLVAKEQQTTVSENLQLPQTVSNAEIILTPPISTLKTEEKIQRPLLPEAPSINKEIITATENVFENKEKNIIIPKEHEKRGSASYPAKPLEIKQQAPTDLTQNLPNTGSIIASEEIGAGETQQASGEQTSGAPERFTYKETVLKDQEHKDLVNPLIDLSGVARDIRSGNRSTLAISSPTIIAVEAGPESQSFSKKNYEKEQNKDKQKNRQISKKKIKKKKKKNRKK
jgi:hypothetical protein